MPQLWYTSVYENVGGALLIQLKLNLKGHVPSVLVFFFFCHLLGLSALQAGGLLEGRGGWGLPREPLWPAAQGSDTQPQRLLRPSCLVPSGGHAEQPRPLLRPGGRARLESLRVALGMPIAEAGSCSWWMGLRDQLSLDMWL